MGTKTKTSSPAKKFESNDVKIDNRNYYIGNIYNVGKINHCINSDVNSDYNVEYGSNHDQCWHYNANHNYSLYTNDQNNDDDGSILLNIDVPANDVKK